MTTTDPLALELADSEEQAAAELVHEARLALQEAEHEAERRRMCAAWLRHTGRLPQGPYPADWEAEYRRRLAEETT